MINSNQKIEVITLEHSVFQEIVETLQAIKKNIDSNDGTGPSIGTWLTTEEVSKLLKVSKRTLQKYRDEGKLGFSQIGSKIYYRSTDIDAFLLENYNPMF
ncbi:helix-turn-helix domain-containing protein [Sphingobacterium spiritivorum]|uniref:DNA binding domain, excisionase family n=1 Tax=Sphingobacterium spiritivorum ATCC 33861 TaxID=525373 RepID=D7VHV1_SPHSI|nr:helix-turn-helix domain-containing protein [Sphingobacterium spiritivorum]EFK59653.1 DNA binding domain, excisionase family [Sphingobacterium spiritivorum ATCC 33861]QQT37691.1 helix-turn-helix domain-containing protein [Sphingobacterium spiritivorum]WQD34494.1 helix-turn-helix domain-containing protein [Sphingobacterium spiritivorum]SUI97474.1 DNA binding domain, excisionase family [Sphingobacterium spiritivorum]